MARKDDGIRDWYVAEYPTDELGEEIREEVTFDGMRVALEGGDDVYDFLGVGDSIVRERCFAELADIFGVDYDVIYYAWLNDGGTIAVA